MSDVIIINVNTNEVTEREYTQDEIDYKNHLESQVVLPEQAEAEIDPNKQSAIIKLQSLGLTEDEAKAIVGL
jgi:hypothetical protein